MYFKQLESRILIFQAWDIVDGITEETRWF